MAEELNNVSTEKKQSGLGTASLVIGIIAISTSFIIIVNNMSFILGIIGAILGIASLIKKASKGKALWGIILSILAIIITLNLQQTWVNSLNEFSNSLEEAGKNLSGDNTESILANNLDVEIGSFKATKSYGIYDTSLPVTLKNKSSESKSFSVHIEAVTSDGERIDDDTILVNSLGAGQSQKLEAFNLVVSDKVPALQKATFKIIDISMY